MMLEAMRCYRRALTLSPRSANIVNNIGAILLVQGKRREAEREFVRALRYDPGYIEAHMNLGTLLCKRGRLKEGLEHMETALRLDPGNDRIREAIERFKLQGGRTRTFRP